MNKNLTCIAGCLLILGIVGCAGTMPSNPDKPTSHPVGFGPIEIGMTKDEIKSLWGEPDMVRNVGESNDMGPTQKEEWIYYSRVSQLPIVNYGYLAKTLHLYFDGKNLTAYKYE